LKSWLGLLDIQPQDWIGFTLSKNGGGIWLKKPANIGRP
jgi:hypothetical protein